jgi:hypothetical protein
VLVQVKNEQEMIGTTYRLLSQTDVVRFFAKKINSADQRLVSCPIDGLGLLKVTKIPKTNMGRFIPQNSFER